MLQKSLISLQRSNSSEDILDLSNKKLSIARAKKHVHKPGYKHTVEKRIEVVTTWLRLGNMRLVAELTGVSYQLCREWKATSWWAELVEEIRASRSTQVDNKLSKLVDRSLDLMEDRLENGDFVYNQKTGEVIRKPVTLRDINTVTKDVLTHQINIQKLEKDEVQHQTQTTIQDQLKMLATEFAKFNRKNTGPIEDAVLIGESDAISTEDRTMQEMQVIESDDEIEMAFQESEELSSNDLQSM